MIREVSTSTPMLGASQTLLATVPRLSRSYLHHLGGRKWNRTGKQMLMLKTSPYLRVGANIKEAYSTLYYRVLGSCEETSRLPTRRDYHSDEDDETDSDSDEIPPPWIFDELTEFLDGISTPTSD
jgi:hypothetical protein